MLPYVYLISDVVSCHGDKVGLKHNLQDVDTLEGTDITLQCPVCIPHNIKISIDYQWYKDGTLLPYERTSDIDIRRAQQKDRGYYHCIAVTTENNVTSNKAFIQVRGKVSCMQVLSI